MEKLKIYLDTSVINFLFADDAPELQKITKEFFDKYVKTAIYEFYISETVIAELNATKNKARKELLLEIFDTYYFEVIEDSISDEVESLALLYINSGIFTENQFNDAIHVACSTLKDIDYLLSWNYKHLANIKRERDIISVNSKNGYSVKLRITTPMEVITNEDI